MVSLWKVDVPGRRLLESARGLIATALALELEAGDLMADQLEDRRCVFLAGLYRAEQTIAERRGLWCPPDQPGRPSTRQAFHGWSAGQVCNWPPASARPFGWRSPARCW